MADPKENKDDVDAPKPSEPSQAGTAPDHEAVKFSPEEEQVSQNP